MPGVRTKTQGAATYWENMKLDKCDGYLIFASGRFTENDGKLADKVRQFTIVDCHWELLKIRKDCLENLKGVESNLVDVYLISNRSPDKWDFRWLTKAFCNALPSLQWESVILTLKATSTEMLNDKIEFLRGCILKVALLLSGVVFIPVPGLSIAADIVLMLR